MHLKFHRKIRFRLETNQILCNSQSRSCTQSNCDHTFVRVSPDECNGLVNLLVKMLLSGFVLAQFGLLVQSICRLSLVQRCRHREAAVRTFASQQQCCRFEVGGIFSPRVSSFFQVLFLLVALQ